MADDQNLLRSFKKEKKKIPGAAQSFSIDILWAYLYWVEDWAIYNFPGHWYHQCSWPSQP